MIPAPQEIRTFFITSVTARRRRLFQVEENALLLISVLEENCAKGRLLLHAFVVMPDHVHFLLTPAPEVSAEKAVQFIKGGFSFRLRSKLPVWEQSFQLHRIQDAGDFAAHREYIEANPVRAGLCSRAQDFEFSSGCGKWRVDPVPEHFRG